MRLRVLSNRRIRILLSLMATMLVIFVTNVALAASLNQISADPYTNASSAHRTEVEPDTFAFGATIVSAFQVGRFFDGGASNIGWSTSTNGGSTWTQGFLPGITVYQGGIWDRVSDASVAYDAKHKTWLISYLPLVSSPSVNAVGVYVSRSTNGGLTWGNPIAVNVKSGLDKNWTVCDNTAASPFYGNCYTEWDDNASGNLIKMSTSSNGGLTWGAAKNTANNATGLGGQPVVQPNGTVVVPIDNANETAVLSFVSTNGGASWSSTTTVSAIKHHTVAGNVRTGPLPSAEVDASGKVYVVWQDCRFRASCTSNDIVMSTSTNGTAWSPVVRIPIDPTSSGRDHFIPGLAVDPVTSGATARLNLAYYYYPVANCTASTCQLNVGYVSSTNGGATWTAPTQLAGPMSLSWIPPTSQGVMVGDYISNSFSMGTAHPVFPVAFAKSGSTFNQPMFAPASGLSFAAGTLSATSDGAAMMPLGAVDLAHAPNPLTRR